MRKKPQVPSIAFTLTLFGALLLLPYLAVSALQWQDSHQQVENAVSVDNSAKRLDLLLRLAPAVNKELLSVSLTSNTALLTELPAAATPILNLNRENEVVDDQAEVDRLLELLGETEIAEELASIRAITETGSADLLGIGIAYSNVRTSVGTMVEEELLTLNSAASATGDAQVSRSARVAEAAADVRIAAVGLDSRWAQILAAAYAPPTSTSVQEFVFGVKSLDERITVLDKAVAPQGPLREQWDIVKNSEALVALLNEYQITADEVARSGVTTDAVGRVDLSELKVVEAISLATQISAIVDAADEVNNDLDYVVNAALIDLQLESSTAVQQALDERQQTVWGLLAAGMLLLVAVLGVGFLIGRPIRLMADAARKLSEGDLDVKVPERGPAEVLIGAKALNQALASLRKTEAQAVALAEQRLDDPILEHETPGELGASLQSAVRRLAESLADREEFRQQLAYDAAHDGLTKLANRTALLKHLNAALARGKRSGSTTAVLFLDLDHFKSVNDSHGHHAGDEMLQTIAERLETVIRDGDLAGRLGGDEFIVVAEDIGTVDEAIALSQRVMAKINEPIELGRATFTPLISIGIGLSNGDLTADELLRDADLAVYRAKSRGRGVIDVCDESLRTLILERALLEADIKVAIAENEFELYVQPIVKAGSNSIASFEALIRWEKTESGFVYPDAFIPVAERSDLIIDVDRWVLCSAGSLLAAWAADPAKAELSLAVNISARHLSSGLLPDSVRAAIDKHQIDPRRLVVELTETALLDDLTIAAQDIADLRSMGVRVALDDFGTGYMSLANLRNLTVDVLKIDGSFVAELESHSARSIVQLIIDAGHLLGIAVTAEGVETQEQADRLTEMGADQLQGYHFGRPISLNLQEDRIATVKAISS